MVRLALLYFCVVAAGCTVATVDNKLGDKEKEAVLAEAAAQIADPNALMPMWYRKSLVPSYTISSVTETKGMMFYTNIKSEFAKPHFNTPMLDHSLWLGLLFFPLAATMVYIREVVPERGLLYSSR